ncbi:hypothetical protein SeMB42_g05534 [Synchytrium endobioticum]|uniref:Uncharacterized protein n=1 Tax=Synchytrium endobioticum TaxID=286115 RepID=A0A507CR79_9FUNG|nr:hypothetical protein SeMB42_g05534 [Synchytrium endobioticum]
MMNMTWERANRDKAALVSNRGISGKEFLLKEHWTPNPWTKDQDHAHEMSSTANVKVVGHQVDDDNSDGPETSKKSFSDGTRAISVAISISDYLKRFKSKTTAMKRKADDSGTFRGGSLASRKTR